MVAVLLAGVMTSGGCFLLLLGGAIGTTAYVMADLEQTLDAPVEDVIAAAKAVVEEMGLGLVSANSTKLEGSVVARNSEDKKLEIDVKSVTDTSSKVSIRKGFFGDGDAQQQVMDKIKDKLKG